MSEDNQLFQMLKPDKAVISLFKTLLHVSQPLCLGKLLDQVKIHYLCTCFH